MTSFNDLMNTNDVINDTYEIKQNYEQNNNKIVETLFTIDLNIPNEKLPFEGIHYLDSNKFYNTKQQLGEYTLKMHQNTTLHYMFGLEQMKYNVKTIKINNIDNVDNVNNVNIDNIDNVKNNITEEYTNHYTNVGILSDQVGAGKSYCIMALLKEAKSINLIDVQFRTNYIGSSNISPIKINKLDTNILLVPHSLIGQWIKYLDKSGLKYYSIQKSKDIYELGDDNCKFKSKPVIKNTKIIEKPIVKPIEKDTKTKAPIKKKIILKSKNTVKESIVEEEPKPIVEEEPKPKPIVEEVSSNNKLKTIETKKKLEAELADLNTQICIINTELDNLRHNPLIRYGNNSIETLVEREGIYESIRDKHKILKLLTDKQYSIKNAIKNSSLYNGIINDSQIQSLHIHNLYYNDATNKEYARTRVDNALHDYFDNLGHINKPYVESLDVILVSDSFYNQFTLYFSKDNYTVNRMIIDECNTVKGSQLLNIKNIFTWLITSSINSMMTSSGYINTKKIMENGQIYNLREKTIMSTGFIMNTINYLYENRDNYKLYLINDPEYIKKSIELPEIIKIILICKDNVNIKVLNGIVSLDIMNMLNAGDIEGIVLKLDVTVGDENNIIKLVTQKFQDELKIKEYELKVAVENPNYKAANENIGIINKRILISDLKSKIQCIEDRVKTVENCPICLDDFINPTITPCCNNKFCFNCITMTLNSKSNCPTCRAGLSIDKLLLVSSDINNKKNGKLDENNKIFNINYNLSIQENIELFKTKSCEYNKYENMNFIFELNKNNTIKKYLIFTEYESTLNTKITSICDKWGLKYGRIRGTSASINKQIENYKNKDGDTNILLINSKFFGSGMNLENTTDIIILHKMSSDIEMQAIGRAQRCGRESQLRIWKLYYQNEST